MTHQNLITDPNLTYSSNHKYLGIFGMIWMTTMVLTLYTAIKTFNFYGLEFSVAILAYPLTYIFNDIFTEVYGYKTSRKIVWTGFGCLIFISTLGYLYSIIPPSPSFSQNEAFSLIFKSAPVVAMVGIVSFFVGEMTNSTILAKIKLKMAGKFAELRYIVSTFFGQLFENTIYWVGIYTLVGFYTTDTIVPLVISSVTFCVLVEIVMLPITKRVIKWIKEQEGIDTYDHGTNFNPFKLG